MSHVTHRRRRVKAPDDHAGQLQEAVDGFTEEREATAVGEKLQRRTQAHGPENIPRGLRRAVLACLHHFHAGSGLRKWQIGIHAQRPAQHDNEEDPQQAAREHQPRRIPEVRAEVRPDSAKQKSGDGESHAGHQRLSD